MIQKTFQKLEKILKKDERLSADDGKLLKNKAIELANKLDEDLINILVADSDLKKVFFKKISDITVFDKDKFVEFISNKEFLPDSYTAFKNKIGFETNGEYLKPKKDVVLVWPYKDCVLEGGQTKEDAKRKEIFWNTTLAPDDVNRLLEQKVLANWKRYDEDNLKTGHKVTQIRDTDNFIIKGNNLLALHSLKKRFAGKVKLIYIDPPYNTGNDSFGYNDSFNHSTWLTFMKNRLEVAYELLSKEGIIFVHCDNHEQAYLRVLMDEIFGSDNFVETITVVNNPRGRDYGGVANMHEYIHIFSKTFDHELYPLTDELKEFPYSDKISGFEIRELRNRNVKFNENNRPNLVYPFYVNPKKKDDNGFFEIALEDKKGWVEVLPAKSAGIQTVWRWGREKASKNLNTDICGKKMQNGGWQIIEKYRKKTRMARSVWHDKEVNSERGTLHLKELFGEKLFDYPKPEELLKRILDIGSKEGDLVLDFFAGSGTTLAVAHKTGRQYIGIEQMEYIHDLPESRLKKVIAGEQGGISKAVKWKGGGDFIYTELMPLNEKFVREVEKVKSKKEMADLWKKIEKNGFLSYRVDEQKFHKNAKDFSDLSLEEQKQFTLESLNKNMLYVNYYDIEDSSYKVSKEDIKLNKDFYGE